MQMWEKLFAGSLALAYVPALMNMAQVWQGVDYYSHGFLVPVVAVWVASRLTRRLARVPRKRDTRGLLVNYDERTSSYLSLTDDSSVAITTIVRRER